MLYNEADGHSSRVIIQAHPGLIGSMLENQNKAPAPLQSQQKSNNGVFGR